jgi:quercetin dioxygenase-like cupin family protein
MHSHTVDARMFVVDGEAELLSDDPQLNGQTVRTGTCVFFERHVNHGFRAGKRGLKFVSENGGIVSADQAWDIAVA